VVSTEESPDGLDVILVAMWTVVVLDVSLSMPMRGYWVAAHRDAMALVGELQDPDNSCELKAVIAFSELPRSVDVVELASMEWDHVYGSNIAAAIHLALAELAGESGRVVIFSDMEATAHVADDGTVVFSFPPAPQTADKTAQAVSDCLSGGVQLEVRRYRDEAVEGASGVDALMRQVLRLGGTMSEVILPSTVFATHAPSHRPFFDALSATGAPSGYIPISAEPLSLTDEKAAVIERAVSWMASELEDLTTRRSTTNLSTADEDRLQSIRRWLVKFAPDRVTNF
jgi:hypothetical protein